MSELPDFEMLRDHAEYRPVREVSLAQAIQLVTAAILFAREQQVQKLLVVAVGLTGFTKPSTVDRYYFTHQWANAAAHDVRLALVVRPEIMDERKFGVTVASNISFATNVFTSEEEALAWLLSDG